MEEENIEVIKQRIVTGVFALTSRTFILQTITFGATFILTILLSPSVFGVFFIVSAVISFLSYFSDIGLAAALIQKKTEPTEEELRSAFTIQQILIGGLVILLIILSPTIAKFYNFGSDGEFLLVALLLSFFLSSLKTIPSILLERKLKFSLLVIPQILETTVFYAIAVILAFLNFDLRSFAWAALGRGIIGLISIYYIQPWKVVFNLNFSSVRQLLTFGIPFQFNSILALIKDDLMVIFLGKILPLGEIGYIGWAKKWAEAPLRLIMDSVIRVTFPTFARLQSDKALLTKAIRKSAFFLALTIVPATIIVVLMIKPLVFLIPRYSKWEPALIPFYLFAFSSLMAAFSSPFVNALNAVGKIKKTLLLMIVWTILTWILTPFLALKIGYIGVSIASFIISFTSILPIIMLKSLYPFSFISAVRKPFIVAFVIYFPALVITFYKNEMYLTFGLLIFTSFLFLISAWFLFKKEIIPLIPNLHSENK